MRRTIDEKKFTCTRLSQVRMQIEQFVHGFDLKSHVDVERPEMRALVSEVNDGLIECCGSRHRCPLC